MCRRRGMSGYGMERLMMPPCSPMGYTLPQTAGVYDMSNCLTGFSDNKITPQMLNAMVDELHNHPDLQDDKSYTYLSQFIGLAFLGIGAVLIITGYGASIILAIGIVWPRWDFYWPSSSAPGFVRNRSIE